MYRLLIVDDEEIIRKGIMRALESMNAFELLCAADGHQALELMQREPVDAVILDVVMPKMDGIAFMERLSGMGISPLIYVLSGYSDFDYARSMLKFGVADYILKPMDRADTVRLGETILKSLAERSRQREKTELLQLRADLLSAMTQESEEESQDLRFSQNLEKLARQVVASAVKDLALSARLMEEGFSRIDGSPERYRAFYKKHFATLIAGTLFRRTVGKRGDAAAVNIGELVDSFEDEGQLRQWLLGEITQFVRIGGAAGRDYYYLSAKEYVDRNYTGDISVQGLADQLWVSPNYLGRIFREKAGEGITDYLKTKRLDHAARLLRDGALRIDEVAGASGIPDQRYFSRVFKERYGLSPRDYRKL